ncbi:MAG: DUF2505 domain-containing protein [Actinomycetota bacterium]|nr:DUF2505 domain-containing protein [Actinomycetota bacterium]
MDFTLHHPVDAAVDDVAAALLDADFQASLADVGGLKSREVLEQKEGAGGTVLRRTRCVLGRDLGAAKRFLGNSEPAWVEEARWNPDDLTWSWRILPEVAADLLSASGTTVLHADGDGTERVVAGTVKVKVPLYGSRVEGVIVRGLEEAYSEEAERLQAWLT